MSDPDPTEEPSPDPEPPSWPLAPDDPSEPDPGSDPYASADVRRDAPDYSGRGEPPLDPAADVLWIPRILFSPLYFISEYVLRQPIGLLVSEIERSNIFGAFFDFFTFGGDDGRAGGLVPTAFFDFGFLPSVGLYFWFNDVGTEGHDIRIAAGFWGPDWLHARVLDRITLDEGHELSFYVEGLRRPDQIFHGGGWDVLQGQRSRFGRSQLGGGVQYEGRDLWRQSGLRYRAEVEYNEFDNSDFDDTGIEQAAVQGWFDLPPGFTNGYLLFRHRLDAFIDTREERPHPGHGVRIQGWFEQGVDLQRADDSNWLRGGGQVGGFVDVGDQRVFSLTGMVDIVEPTGAENEVPFTEQVWLSQNPLHMGGFLPGQLVGRSAAVLALEYRYPIWVWLEGSVHYSIGNAFGPRLDDFQFDRLRQSFGFGFRTIGDRDNSALLSLAFGTEPFVRGAGVTSVRFVVGSQSGF